MIKECSLIGAALDLGQQKSGVEIAPSWLRLKGVVELLNNKFFHIDDLGDLAAASRSETKNQKLIEALSHYGHRLSQVVEGELKKDRFVLTLGGDHSIAVGTLGGVLKFRPQTKVIWVDAHADINTPKTSPSGNLHGMPVAFALKLSGKKEFPWLNQLAPENIIYLGLRDIDKGEKAFLEDLKITAYTTQDIQEKGIQFVLDEILKIHDPHHDQSFHLSFDVDAIDPYYFPSTGTPVRQGLDLIDGANIIRTMFQTGRLLGLDLVEINPSLGSKQSLEKTVSSTKFLLDSIPSWDRLQKQTPNKIWPTSESMES